MLFTHVWTLLQKYSHGDIPIFEIEDRKDSIALRLDGIADGELEIDMKVVIEIVEGKKGKYLRVEIMEGSMMERIWADQYFRNLLCEA